MVRVHEGKPRKNRQMQQCEFEYVPFISNQDKVRETCTSLEAGVAVVLDGEKYVVCIEHAVYLFCADTAKDLKYGDSKEQVK